MVVFPLKDRYLKKIFECELSGPDHAFRKTLATFDVLYGKFHHYKIRRDSFRNLFEVLRGSLYPPDITLWDLKQIVFSWVVAQIGLKLHVTETTVLTPVRPEHPSEWVAVMGAALGCKLYLGGGAAAAAYLRPGDFIKRGMAYVSQEYTMPPYKRTSTSTSTDAMVSILDPLFVGGADLVKELIDRPAWSRP